MGKVKNTSRDEETSDVAESLPNSVPEDMRIVSADRSAKWWKAEEGKSVQGYLLGRYERTQTEDEKKKEVKRAYYQIRLTKPCEILVYDDKDKGQKHAELLTAGSIVNLDEFLDVAMLASLLPDEEVAHEVFVKALEKVRSKKNTAYSFWRFQVAHKPVSVSLINVPF